MRTKGLDTCLIFLGVTGLVFKKLYSGPYQEVVYSYGGNLTVSFAVYFIVIHMFHFHQRLIRLYTVLISLTVVELFELLNGFGIMTNIYDMNDIYVNAAGIVLAFFVDITVCKGRFRVSNSKIL